MEALSHFCDLFVYFFLEKIIFTNFFIVEGPFSITKFNSNVIFHLLYLIFYRQMFFSKTAS